MDEENGHIPSVLLRNFFWKVEVINRMHERNWNQQFIDRAVKALDMSHLQGERMKIIVAPKVEGD